MTLADALDIQIARTGHARYRWLCSEDNPDHAQRDAYRRLVIQQASGPWPPQPDLAVQAIADIRQSGVTQTARRGCCGG
jgi:hypothetical protein